MSLRVWSGWVTTDDVRSRTILSDLARHRKLKADINDKVTSELQSLKASKAIRDWRSKVLGGGRISHDPDAKSIKVYGYSQGYGKADHQLSVDILKKTYPDYEITFSDEGY